MIRVLHVYPQLNNAGTEKVIFNLYNSIDRKKVQFDFLVEKKGILDDAVKVLGGKIYFVDETNNTNYYNALKSFFYSHPEYQIVHTHTHKRMGIVLKAARYCGVKCRIAHSHNARSDLSKIFWIAKSFTSIPIELNATHFIACSEIAAKWLFPHKYKRCSIWENGIDLNEFMFCEEARYQIRTKYGITDDDKVICHVGRFARQKNHERIVSIIKTIMQSSKNIKVFLVGTGPLLDSIKSKLSNLDNIFFLGNRNDVSSILSGSDIFLFPSLWEGLGIVAIEAQANGLICLASENVPEFADLQLGSFYRKDLDENDVMWADELMKLLENDTLDKRIERSSSALSCKYDIKKVSQCAQEFYLSR